MPARPGRRGPTQNGGLDQGRAQGPLDPGPHWLCVCPRWSALGSGVGESRWPLWPETQAKLMATLYNKSRRASTATA